MTQATETRVTEWQECADGPWYPSMSHGGLTHYRIWQQFDGMRWFQRHEWKRANGTTEMQDWISGGAGWCETAMPAEQMGVAA